MKNSLEIPIEIRGAEAAKGLEKIKSDNADIKIVDTYPDQLEELFLLRNPRMRFVKDRAQSLGVFLEEYKKKNGDLKFCGSWFYFPWLRSIFHILPEDEFFEMRTGRNRYLITEQEQKNFYNSTIAIAGLSVGSHVAFTIVMNGGGKFFKIADPDTLSGSNLNRVRTGFTNIGEKKTDIVARQLYEMNPYIKLEIFENGLNSENIGDFLNGGSLIIEETDDPYYKFKIREEAKSRKIPVIMGTDNGDNVFVDVERYDIESNLSIFNGKVEGITAESLRQLDPQDLPRVAARIAGAEIATTRMQQSVLEVGKTIYSWPQLGTAANLCGTALAYTARNILNNNPDIKSGRYEINIESSLDSGYVNRSEERKNATAEFLKKIGL